MDASKVTAVATAIALSLLTLGCGKKGEPVPSPQGGGATPGSSPYPPLPGGADPGSLAAGKNLAVLAANYPSAVLSPSPWAGFWFPYSGNGIAVAAQKYDAAASVPRAGALGWELGHHGSGLAGIAEWWGHCNGWSAAAVLTAEPRQAVTVDGIAFEVADRKALLSETFMEVTGDFLGTRTEYSSDYGGPAYLDVVPAQFHLVLTNVMGAQRRPLIIDRYTGFQVWNHPLVAYAMEPIRPSDYLGPDPSFPNIHRLNVSTRIFWVENNVEAGILTPRFDPAAPDPAAFGTRLLRYELWLDAPPVFDGSGTLVSSGDIVLVDDGTRAVGGTWKNGELSAENSHPDYIWIPTGPAPSSGFKNPSVDDAWVLSNMTE